MRIYIVGMPGSGKTYIGRLLAQTISAKFIDLDEVIEKNYGKMIREIVQEQGDAAFRKIESQCLTETISYQNIIVSCGGGTPVFNNNLEWMKNNGIVIWLNTPIHLLSERINGNITRRPMFMYNTKEQVLEKLTALLNERKKYYQQSDLIVNNNGIGKMAGVKVIQMLVKQLKYIKK